MPLNEFDALLNDLRTVQDLRAGGVLNKALALSGVTAHRELADLQRRVTEMEHASGRHPATRSPAIPELGPVRTFRKALGSPSAPARRPTTREEARAKVHEAAPEIMKNAMAKFRAGKITATELSAIEARVHHFEDAVA